MKSILKILVLGVVPILAATAVVDQGLAADKGSQLIFHSNMYHKNFISVSNTSGKAVTVLVQYYNDELKQVLYYLRVITGGGSVLVDPFDHEIPGTATKDKDGKEMPGTATNVSAVLDQLPAMSTEKPDKAGINSGRFVITVTAVGANVAVDENKDKDAKDVTASDGTANQLSEENNARTVNVLFPAFLAAGLHGTDNIDNGGVLIDDSVTGSATVDASTAISANIKGAENAAHSGENLKLTKFTATTTVTEDNTSKNVGGLTVANAVPIAFNHLTGHSTEALISTAAGGADQTASWGGTPIIRPGVLNNDNDLLGTADEPTVITDDVTDYLILDGKNSAPGGQFARADSGDVHRGGRLAEKDAGGTEKVIHNEVSGYTTEGGNKILNGNARNRGLNSGALVLPALHGGGDETEQIMLLLSAADNFGGAGGYKLRTAKTKYNVSLEDSMGDALPSPADDRVFGGATGPDLPKLGIIVEGIRVMIDAGDCGGTMLHGAWSLADLIELVPTASSGSKKFDGVGAMVDPMVNAGVGSIKFKRAALKCKYEHGDGDDATSSQSGLNDGDGVPSIDTRTYAAGTLIVEEPNSDHTFITTGQAVLKFITPQSTFAASWSLKSPASKDDPARTAAAGTTIPFPRNNVDE